MGLTDFTDNLASFLKSSQHLGCFFPVRILKSEFKKKREIIRPPLSDVFTLAEESLYLFRLVETGHQLRLEVVFHEVDHEVHDGLVIKET